MIVPPAPTLHSKLVSVHGAETNRERLSSRHSAERFLSPTGQREGGEEAHAVPSTWVDRLPSTLFGLARCGL